MATFTPTAPVKAVLLDIEGTTSSIRFVYDVMFPMARRNLDGYLRGQWGAPPLTEACEQIARDAGHAGLAEWSAAEIRDKAPADDKAATQRLVANEVRRLMDGDIKATGLKQLQGMIWKQGFESGEMQAHVYDDVPKALQHWKQLGCDLRIYSSGSVQAQKLFFAHTIAGDLLHYFSGHYDTKIGGKREPASYQAIVADWGVAAQSTLFASDVTEELDAAASAGLQTVLCVRPNNAAPTRPQGHPSIKSFDDITMP